MLLLQVYLIIHLQEQPSHVAFNMDRHGGYAGNSSPKGIPIHLEDR